MMTHDELFAIGSAIAAGLTAFAAFFPRILASIRQSNLEGGIANTQHSMVDGMHVSYEKQLKSLTERIEAMDDRIQEMDGVIAKQQIKLTRLQVLVIQLEGLLVANEVLVPPSMKTEIARLVAESREHGHETT